MEHQERHQEGPIVDYLATFKFYDSKNRRLSIFGRLVDDKLQITVLTLSNTPEVKKKLVERTSRDKKRIKKVVQTVDFVYDTFSRKEGRRKYEEECLGGEKCPGRVYLIDITDNRPRYSFLKWCNEHFYREWKEEVTMVKKTFVRGQKYSELIREMLEKKEAVVIPLAEHESKSKTIA